jgi:hypothetical protein
MFSAEWLTCYGTCVPSSGPVFSLYHTLSICAVTLEGFTGEPALISVQRVMGSAGGSVRLLLERKSSCDSTTLQVLIFRVNGCPRDSPSEQGCRVRGWGNFVITCYQAQITDHEPCGCVIFHTWVRGGIRGRGGLLMTTTLMQLVSLGACSICKKGRRRSVTKMAIWKWPQLLGRRRD